MVSNGDAVDTSVPSQVGSDAQILGLSKADIKRNMIAIILLESIFYMGFTDLQLAMQPLLVYLKASNSMIGIINGATIMGLVGVFFSPWITRRFRYKKWYMFVVHMPYIGSVGLMGLAVLMSKQFGLSDPSLLMVVFGLTLAHWFFSGFVSLPHQEYTAACIPMAYRGRYSGWSFSVGGVLSIGSAMLGGWVLSHYSKPMAFGYVLLMAWAIAQSGFLFALLGKELPTPVEKSPKPWSKSMFKAVWEDKPYVRFLTIYALSNAIIYPTLFTFINVYGFRELGMRPETSALIQVIGQAARIGACVFIGIITDKIGPKRVYPFWFLIAGIGIMIPVMIGSPIGVYIASAFAALYVAGTTGAFGALLYGLPSPENRAGHFAIQLILMFVTASIGPIMIGRLCDLMPYRTLFIIVAAACVALFLLGRYLLSSLSDNVKSYS